MEDFYSNSKLILKDRDIVQEAKQLFNRFPHFKVADADTFFTEGIDTLQDNLSLWLELEDRNSLNLNNGLRQYPINYYDYQGSVPECMYFVARYFNTLILAYYVDNELGSLEDNRKHIIFHLHNRSWIEAYYGELETAQAYLAEAVKQMMNHFPAMEWRPDLIEDFAQLTKLIQEQNDNTSLFILEYGKINQLVLN